MVDPDTASVSSKSSKSSKSVQNRPKKKSKVDQRDVARGQEAGQGRQGSCQGRQVDQAKADKLAAKEAAKAAKAQAKADKEAEKAAKEQAKADKLAAKEQAKADKLAAKEQAKADKLAAKEQAKADKLAAKEQAKEQAKADKLAAKEQAKADKLAAKEQAKEQAKAEKLATAASRVERWGAPLATTAKEAKKEVAAVDRWRAKLTALGVADVDASLDSAALKILHKSKKLEAGRIAKQAAAEAAEVMAQVDAELEEEEEEEEDEVFTLTASMLYEHDGGKFYKTTYQGYDNFMFTLDGTPFGILDPETNEVMEVDVE